MRKVSRVIWVLCAALLVAAACDGNGTNGGSTPEPQENPIPQLSGISPDSAAAHLPAFTLTVRGSEFVNGAVIVFNGVEMDTEYVSSGELTCMVQPEDTLLSSLSAAHSVGLAVDSEACHISKGMELALPYVDFFLPANSLEGLRRVGRTLCDVMAY